MINDKIESKYRELSIKYKTKVFYYYDNLLKKVFKNMYRFLLKKKTYHINDIYETKLNV